MRFEWRLLSCFEFFRHSFSHLATSFVADNATTAIVRTLLLSTKWSGAVIHVAYIQTLPRRRSGSGVHAFARAGTRSAPPAIYNHKLRRSLCMYVYTYRGSVVLLWFFSARWPRFCCRFAVGDAARLPQRHYIDKCHRGPPVQDAVERRLFVARLSGVCQFPASAPENKITFSSSHAFRPRN